MGDSARKTRRKASASSHKKRGSASARRLSSPQEGLAPGAPAQKEKHLAPEDAVHVAATQGDLKHPEGVRTVEDLARQMSLSQEVLKSLRAGGVMGDLVRQMSLSQEVLKGLRAGGAWGLGPSDGYVAGHPESNLCLLRRPVPFCLSHLRRTHISSTP